MTFRADCLVPPIVQERLFTLALRQHVKADDSVLHGVYPAQYQRHIYLRGQYIDAALEAKPMEELPSKPYVNERILNPGKNTSELPSTNVLQAAAIAAVIMLALYAAVWIVWVR